MMRLPAIYFFLYTVAFSAFSQSPNADFTTPSIVCKSENLLISNLSSNAIRYEWDFCQGDLAGTPEAIQLQTLSGNVTTGIEIVFDGTNWFGFITNQNSDELIRLEFGADIHSTPVVTRLGNINGLIKTPTDIKVINENGQWYGFVYGLTNPFISRIDFGSSLSNNSNSLTGAVILQGAGYTNGGFDMIRDGNIWYMVVTDNSTFRIIRLTSISDVPDILQDTLTVSNPFANGMGDVFLTQDNGNFYGYVVAYENKTFQKLTFGSSVFVTPVIKNITLPSGSKPYGIDGGFDNGNHYIFISTIEGNLLKGNLGSDLSLLPTSPVSLGNFSTLESTLKIKLVKHKSEWIAFTPSWITTKLYRVDFPNPACEVSSVLTEAEPVVNFSTQGPLHFTLRAFNDSGVFSDKTNAVEISGNASPVLNINYENTCITAPTGFSVTSPDDFLLDEWNFGDTNLSTDLNPVHQYSTEGNYRVFVFGRSLNGCTNFSTKNITIHALPQTNFDLPTGLICTNNEFTFQNTTPESDPPELSYQWFVQAEQVGVERNLQYTFSTTGNKTIKLIASNPGCTKELVKDLTNVPIGPTVDFSLSGVCENEEITFKNNSVGDIASYSWFLDNVPFSTEKDPVKNLSPEIYTVNLNVTGSNGCLSTTFKQFEIYPKALVNFENYPDVLCSNAVVDFKDISQTPSGSTLTAWKWTFGDNGNESFSTDAQHTYSASGNYEVSLTVTTNFGCTDSIAKQITINKSPSAEFTNSTACEGLPVSLSAIDPDSKSWIWKIGDKTYQTKSPAHTFRDPGDFEIIVKVTSVNGCETSETRSIKVPAPLIPDFSWTKNCVGQQVIFADLTTGLDPVIDWRWNMNEETELNGNPGLWSWDQPGDKIIGLAVTAMSGCTYSVTKTISIVPMPKASFTPMPQIGTPPAPIRFSNLSTNATMYYWDFNDGTYSDETAPEHIFLNEGDFNVILKAYNDQGCQNNVSRQVVISPPSPDVSIKAITTSDNADGSIKVVITLENEGNTSLTNLPVYIDISGNLSLREVIEGPILPMSRYNLTLSYGLRRSKELTFLCAGTELANDQNPEQNKSCVQFENELLFLSAYPNPVREYLTVEWIARQDEEISISILNATGHSIREYRVMSEPGFNHEVIDVSEFQKGIYLLVLKGHSTKSTQHIIISN